MLRGWIRATPRYPAGPQRKALEAAGCKSIYEASKDETFKDFARGLRRGDVAVVDGYDRLAPTRPGIHHALELVAEMGCQVMDARSGEVGTAKMAARMAEAFRISAGERKIRTHREAVERGKEGGRPKGSGKLLKRDAIDIWRNPDLTNEEAAAIIGLSVRQCYRKFKKSGRPAGWRTAEAAADKRKPKPSR